MSVATVWQSVFYDLKREDQVSASLADDGTVTETLQLYYTAVTDGTSRGTTVEAMSANDGTTAMPTIGSTLVLGGSPYTVRTVQPRRSGPNSFEVQIQATAIYSPVKTGKWNVSIKTSGQPYTQDAHFDSQGKAVVNSATQAFDPTVTQTFSDEKFEISYSTDQEQSEVFNAVRNKVNSGPVSFNIQGVSRSFDTRQLKVDDVTQTATSPKQDGTPVFGVSISLSNRADGFVTNVLDQGLYQLNNSGGSLTLSPILDANNKSVTTPVLLDGTGKPLQVTGNTTSTANTTGDDDDSGPANVHSPNVVAHYMAFKLEYEEDLSVVFEGLS